MRISDFARITHSSITHTGDIKSYEGICFEASKVSRSNLYIHISNNPDDIKIAINQGCYCIMYEAKTSIIDTEIAWLQSSDITKSLISLIKYKNLQTHLIYLDDVSFDIVKSISKNDGNIEYLSGNIPQILDKAINQTQYKFTNIHELQSISKNTDIPSLDINILKTSLFNTTVIIDEMLCELSLPLIYIDKLRYTISLLKALNISYDIHKLTLENSFFVVFVDEYITPKRFGSTQKAVIFTSTRYMEDISLYLQKHSKWASIHTIKKSSGGTSQILASEFTYLITDISQEIFFSTYAKLAPTQITLF